MPEVSLTWSYHLPSREAKILRIHTGYGLGSRNPLGRHFKATIE